MTRDSGVPWIGQIRADWPIVPAKAVFKQRSTASRPDDVHLTPSQQHGVMPQAEYMALTGNQVVLNLSGADNMRHVEPGDYISHLRSFQGGLEYSAYAGKVSAAYTVLTPRKEVDPHYFRFLFKSNQYVQGLQTTTDQMRDGQSIRYGQFALLPLPCPPLDEQWRIAEFLDRETAQIDELIAKQEQLISTLAERETSRLTDLLRHEEAGAPVMKLRWLATIANGDRGVNYPSPDELLDEGIPFVSAGDLADGALRFEHMRYVSPEKYAAMGGAKLRHGDVLYCLRGSVGKVAIVHDLRAGSLASSLAAVRVRATRELHPEYLYLILSSDYEFSQRIVKLSGSAQPNLGAAELGDFRFPIPSIDAQAAIVDRAAEVVRVTTALRDRATRIVATLRERRQALISAAVTGQIELGGAS